MKSEFVIDSEELSRKECSRIESALTGAAESDLPLVFEVVFLSPEEIRALNARERGVDAVTDVLSFPATDGIKGKPLSSCDYPDCWDGEGRLFLGSIAVCKERAAEQAEEYGHSMERELNYLIVHGVLHCLGYDHMTESDKAEMRAREEEIMQKMSLTR